MSLQPCSAIPIESAAALAGCSIRAIRLLAERGRLTCEIEHDCEMIDIASLVRYLNARPPAMRQPPRIREYERRHMEVT